MMATVSGPIVKMTNAMCSQRISRSVNDSDLAAAAAARDRDRSMKAILGPRPPAAAALGFAPGPDQPGHHEAESPGGEQDGGPVRVRRGRPVSPQQCSALLHERAVRL